MIVQNDALTVALAIFALWVVDFSVNAGMLKCRVPVLGVVIDILYSASSGSRTTGGYPPDDKTG